MAVLLASDVGIWRADVPASAPCVEALASTLSRVERAWAARLEAGGARERFVAGRAALREVLGAHLCTAPAAVPLRVGADGRPELDVPGEPPLRFSVSHAGAVVLVAIARGRIGIDLEGSRALHRALEVAARSFARSELALLRRAPPGIRPHRFLEIWTAKEAVRKASGAGRPALAQVEVSPGPDGALSSARGAGARWAVRIFEPALGYVAAAAAGELPESIEVLPLRR